MRTIGSKNRKTLLFGRVDNMANENNLSPEEAKTQLIPTEKPEDVTSGDIVETFSISVKDDDDTVIYTEKNQPFKWTKVDNLPAIFAEYGGELNDEQVTFLGEALKDAEGSESIGKATKKIIDMFNSVTRSNAKQNEYSRVMNLKKPLVGEKRDSAVETMVTTFMRLNKVSREVALEQVNALLGITVAKTE